MLFFSTEAYSGRAILFGSVAANQLMPNSIIRLLRDVTTTVLSYNAMPIIVLEMIWGVYGPSQLSDPNHQGGIGLRWFGFACNSKRGTLQP